MDTIGKEHGQGHGQGQGKGMGKDKDRNRNRDRDSYRDRTSKNFAGGSNTEFVHRGLKPGRNKRGLIPYRNFFIGV
jgi:hypothetical protein